jgi:pre-mRNA-processing factor 19
MEDEIGPDGKKIRPGINPVMIEELTECNTMLSAQRKKRQVYIVLLISFKSRTRSKTFIMVVILCQKNYYVVG